MPYETINVSVIAVPTIAVLKTVFGYRYVEDDDVAIQFQRLQALGVSVVRGKTLFKKDSLGSNSFPIP